MQWLQSKTGTECASCSSDGQVGLGHMVVSEIEAPNTLLLSKYGIAWTRGGTMRQCNRTLGQVLWWDIRKLGEPTMSMALEPKSSTGDGLLGGVSMDYSAAVCAPACDTIRALAAARARRACC